MPRLVNKDTGKEIGTVSDEDIQFLVEQLEEEDSQDTDYFISADTVRLLEDNGASEELLEALRSTLVEMYGEEILDIPEEEDEDLDDEFEDDEGEPLELEDEELEDDEVLGFELAWKK